MLRIPMATLLVKTSGQDIQNPGTYYWDIRSADFDQIIVMKGFPSLKAAQQDQHTALVKLIEAVGVQQP